MALIETEDNGLGSQAGRLTALVSYGLLIVAPFTLGTLALAAMAIAYLRRKQAGPLARSHFDYQIRSFWTDISLVGLGALFGGAAVATGGGAVLGFFGITLPQGLSTNGLGWTTIGLGLAWLILWLWGLVGLLLGSVHGSIKLAAGLPMGKTRRP